MLPEYPLTVSKEFHRVAQPQEFSHQLASFPNSQRMVCPCPGAAGNSCFMCNKMAHFLNHCPILLEYICLGKAARNLQNMVMLSNRDPIPPNQTNHPWAARLMSTMLGTHIYSPERPSK